MSTPTSQNDAVREQVAKDYARAVARPTPSCCNSQPTPKGVAVKLAGYDSDQVSELPADAVVNSFGCGNPLAFSEVSEGDTVLDLGSGAGIDLLIAAGKVGPSGRVIGVDMADEMIARARANIGDAGLSNVEVRKGIIEDLPIESETVDWVISNCVINLSPDKPGVFREIARVLKPDGRMLVSDIVVEEMPDELRADNDLYSSCVAGAIGESEYLEGLRSAGMVDVEVCGRLVYDDAQLRGFIASELSDPAGDSTCAGANVSGTRSLSADALTRSLSGKVSSIAVHAVKRRA